jgi:hypothetical protein
MLADRSRLVRCKLQLDCPVYGLGAVLNRDAHSMHREHDVCGVLPLTDTAWAVHKCVNEARDGKGQRVEKSSLCYGR